MKFTQLLAATGLVASVAAVPHETRDGKFGCGTQATEEFLAVASAMQQGEANGTIGGEFRTAAAAIVVDTYFHVVARSSSVSGGYLSNATLIQQLDVMNEDFASSGIQFRHISTDYTINTSWASDGNELAMKKALRKGSYSALNLYFLYSIDGFGYCYLPASVTSGSDDFYYDACTILASTVPGGSETNYNLGKTVTHEVGHWFGLLHTFQGNSCSGSGDSVSDTPVESTSTNGCPTDKDSCPNQSGADPIHNYMDYSYDSCYTEFTSGQNTRMTNMWSQYRSGK